uniref:Leukocyte elastase inhibitor n=1 Tax=Leptobrachium leishanense TaxID=445787 RepID=A0A8C5MIT3_9ANUR
MHIQTVLGPSVYRKYLALRARVLSRFINMDSLSASNGSFALNLFRRLSEDNECNIFFSPFSVSSALAMVYLGTKGNTAAQMSQVLQFEKAKDLHTDFQALISAINKPDTDYILRTANRLYGEKSFTFLAEFLGSTKKYYLADLQSVDFCTKAEECRKEINAWVEQKTEGKIQDLLPSGSVDALTRLVLVNAIYFKGNWANQFDKQATKEMPFRINKNDTKPVQMMYKKAKYQMTYIPDLLTKVIELPYVNNELSMLILLPDDIEDSTTGLEKLELDLTFSKFMEWTNPEMMEKDEVELLLPKFKMENNYDLESALISMGMSDAFDVEKSDFSGMSGSRDLVLSKVVHKSFVEVNEEGTEAAAATGAVVMLRCARYVQRITCDHPFLFYIIHKESRSILFFGRFCSP